MDAEPGGEELVAGEPEVLFEEIIEVGPGVGATGTWDFTVPGNKTKLGLEMVEYEGATAGDFNLSVMDALGNETVLLDAHGVRYGTSGYSSGFIGNGGVWDNPAPGTWTIYVESDGQFQQHIIIKAI